MSKVNVPHYGRVENTLDGLATAKKDTLIKLDNYEIELSENQNSWLLKTEDLTWKYSSFANQVRNRIDICGRHIREARETLNFLRTFKNQ